MKTIAIRGSAFGNSAAINKDQTGSHLSGKANLMGHNHHRHALFGLAEDGSPEALLTASSNPRLQEFLQHVS
jgi:hypothetical protein